MVAGAKQISRRDAPSGAPAHGPRGLFWDPFSVLDALGYRESTKPITFDVLRGLPYRVPVLGAMILNAVTVASRNHKQPEDRFGSGLVVRPKGWKPGDKLTRADEKFADRMEDGLANGSFLPGYRGFQKLRKFLIQFLFDSYRYDQACFEIIPDNRGRPVSWVNTDGASIRLADVPYTIPRVGGEMDPDAPFTVQVYNGDIVHQYTYRDLAFCVRNPRTDIKLGGYGTAEAEMIVHTLARLINADEYNARMFSNGTHAKGILNVKGEIGPERFDEFRRDFNQEVRGVHNAFRTPITRAKDGLEFISFQMSNREMEFSAGYDFWIKLVGGHILMDPAEIHFRYGTMNQKSTMNAESNRERVLDSRARWLPPLLEFAAESLTEHLIEPWDQDWEAAFVGLDAQTPKEIAELWKMRVESTHTIDEAREALGLEERGEEKGGDVIENSVWFQWMQFQQQAEQQAQAMAAGGAGAPGEEGAVPGAGGGPAEAQGQPGAPDQGDDYESLLAQLGGAGDEEQPSARSAARPPRMAKSMRVIEAEV